MFANVFVRLLALLTAVDEALSISAPNSAPNVPVIDLGYASYKGSALPNGVNQFLGIRYAAAPLGNLRWRAPKEPKKEPGVQDATAVSGNFTIILPGSSIERATSLLSNVVRELTTSSRAVQAHLCWHWATGERDASGRLSLPQHLDAIWCWAEI
jgi:hypothetical protein